MDEQRSFITITLDLQDPIEVGDFVGLFASIADQYERYIRTEHPKVDVEAKIFIKEIRKGSIIADLFPGGLSDLIEIMDHVLIVAGFSALVGKIIQGYISGKRNPNANKSDLKNYLDTVRIVANDSNGRAVIERTTYKQGVMSREVVFEFDTKQARAAAKQIETHKQELDQVAAADYARVMMVFRQANVRSIATGKRTGERVIIEEVSDKELPLIYASDLAEQQIKHEVILADENVFKRGFIVDVNVQTKNGKAVGYRVTNLHQVIDLPEDSEDHQSINLIE